VGVFLEFLQQAPGFPGAAEQPQCQLALPAVEFAVEEGGNQFALWFR